MPQSIPLDLQKWDLVLDQYGNLDLETEVGSIAQDVACAIRTFRGECRYNQQLGMPYFQSILWQYPPGSLVVAAIQQQALTIKLVTGCVVPSLQLNPSNRQLSGLAVITTVNSPTNLAVRF